MTRDAAMTTRVEPAVKAAIQALAKADNRSDAQYIEQLLINHLKGKGMWPPPKRKPSKRR